MNRKSKSKRDRDADDLEIPELTADFFRHATMGKYYSKVMENSKVVRIAPELHKKFPNEVAVNHALRELVQLKVLLKKLAGEPPTIRRKRSA